MKNGQHAHHTLNRRHYLFGSGIAALYTGAGPGRFLKKKRKHKKFVCILVPGLRPDAVSGQAFPFLKTPNIDYIANQGIVFQKAYSVTSSTDPALESILTGTYPHRHGIIDNSGRRADVKTVLSLPDILKKKDFKTTVLRAQSDAASEIDRLTGSAGRFLRTADQDSFGLFLELPAIEPPTHVPSGFSELFQDVKIDQPHSWTDSLENKPFWKRRNNPWIIRSSEQVPSTKKDEPWDSENSSTINYLRAVAATDEAVGRIIRILEITQQLDNTLLVFAGTHGCLLGEHGLTGGRYAYEESIHVPIMLHFPKSDRPEINTTQTALTIDLAPTLLDWIRPGSSNPFQGMPLNSPSEIDREFLYEYWMDQIPSIPRTIALHTGRFKYIRYPDLTDLDELYDLEQDPHELRNLITALDSTAIRIKYKNRLNRMIKQTGYERISLPPPDSPLSRKLPRGLLINYGFDQPTNGIIANKALFPINTPIENLSTTKGYSGDALRIKPGESLEIPRSSLLNLAIGPWAVDLRFMAGTDGTVLSHGSATNHYAVFIEQGIPCVSIRKGKTTVVLSGTEPAIGKWVNLRVNIGNELAVLTINNQRVDQMYIPQIFSEAHYTIRIGENPDIHGDPDIMESDLPSLGPGFNGAVDSLKIIRQ